MEEIIFSAKQVNGIPKKIFSRDKFVLRDVDFELPAGYIMGIIGKNGAGKTTFFDYIMDENKRYTGEFLLDGVELHSNHSKMLNDIGFISEKHYFFDAKTCLENVEMLSRFYDNFDIELFKATMEEYKLSARKVVGNLSRGENMRFQMAYAVAYRPKLYLIDEATAGMDPVFREDFYSHLRKLLVSEEAAIIMSTHIDEEIESKIDYVGLLEEGRFVSFKENGLS